MFDVEIHGAGPVGSYLANRLSKRGYSVHLVERVPFPRDKLCGGGLTQKSLTLIRELEPSFDRSGVPEYVHQFVLVQPRTLEHTTVRTGENSVALVRRRDFDAWMLDRALDAGVQCSDRPAGARYIVAADGAGSKLGRSIRGPFPAEEVAVATESAVSNERGPYLAIVLNPTGDPHDLGYSWSFARSDGAAVGTAVRRDRDRHLVPYRTSAAEAASRLFGHGCAGFRNWIVPLYSRRPAAKGNVALVGDALGTADPLFLEGIASGLRSARVLADSFETHGDFSRYEEELRGHPYFVDMRFVELLQHRGNADFELTYAIFSHPGELRRLMGLIAGNITAREYVLWLFARHPLVSGRLWLKARAPS